MSSYDENLSENAFFRELRRSHGELLGECVVRGWIVCVPRASSLSARRDDPAADEFLAHVLQPDDELPGERFFSLAGETVTRRPADNCLLVGADERRRVELLFEETFYAEEEGDGRKHLVWCVDRPLDRPGAPPPPTDAVSTLHSIGGRAALEQIDELVRAERFVGDDVETLAKIAANLYEKCLQALGRRAVDESVKVALESYVLEAASDRLEAAIGAAVSEEEARLNKAVRNLSSRRAADFGVERSLERCLPQARAHLARVRDRACIAGKAACVVGAMRAVKYDNSKAAVNLDRLVPALAFALVKARAPDWRRQLALLTRFRLSARGAAPPPDEAAYATATLEAVVEHVEQGPLARRDTKRRDATKNPLAALFVEIELGNLQTVEEMLDRSNDRVGTPPTINFNNERCHPLCRCLNCHGSSITVNSLDDFGQTLLHAAASAGQGDIVDSLLRRGAEIDATDNSGSTPLHCAAREGQVDALLRLLQAKANSRIKGVDGNSALHLAADRGHESCAEALTRSGIEFDPNEENLDGSTPLQIASHWGYGRIVEVLLERGGDAKFVNSRGENAMHVALDRKIERLLKSCHSNNFVDVIRLSNNMAAVIDVDHKESECVFLDLNQDLKPKVSHLGNKSRSVEEIRRTERLFRAIAFGDVQLACFYMGLDPTAEERPAKSSSACHPLCVCQMCAGKSAEDRRTFDSFDVNDACDPRGDTTLHIAVRHSQTRLCKILLRNGARADVRNHAGATPLHSAARDGKLDISKLLIEFGASLDAKDCQGNTPLHSACMSGNMEIVRLMLAKTDNVCVKNASGKTPLSEAKDRMYMTIMTLFRDAT